MFTQPISTPPGPTATSPVSPSRPSRLRGLSYLRNYTHSHLLSRDNTHSGTTSGTTSPAAPSSNNNTNATAAANNSNLTRSISYSPTSSASPVATTNTTNLGATNGGRLSLVSSNPTQPQAAIAQRTAPTPSNPSPTAESGDQPREQLDPDNGTTSAANPHPSGGATADDQSNMTRNRASTNGDAAAAATTNGAADNTPSIRFSAYYDPRSTRPSLSFPPITRNLPTGSEIIRVGRYSERDTQMTGNNAGNQPSAAPVGFKSKVVSRRHCEFWHEDGKWYIRDVKSSSGTFLNHIRLSPPSQESKAFPVNDGDIVQLGIDFKGGEEMIFRCVKMRLELNRGWQNKPNNFNMAAHKRLRTMANSGAAGSNTNSQDCSICLNSIAPCQSLFVAPCSHTWHFKCVRSLLTSPQYPIFICPNCRAGADLEADVDEPSEEWQQLEEEMEVEEKSVANGEPAAPPESAAAETEDSSVQDGDAMEVTVHITSDSSPNASHLPHESSAPVPINNPVSGSGRPNITRENRTPSPPGNGNEGPITPRNDVGPWVFDGSAGVGAPPVLPEMRSLNAAAEMDLTPVTTGETAR